ncbi:MAG: CRR6 family NdhI maturation factor [Synechococcus sp. ELA057]
MASSPSPLRFLVTSEAIRDLDLSSLAPLRQRPLAQLLPLAGTLELQLEWPRLDEDPRELSEIPELRLWSLRADAVHPWLPLLLERSTGQLTRHVAMLLPHGFNRQEGIRFAPECLELWITHRLFQLDEQARQEALNCRGSLSQMATALGFELDPQFWSQLPPAGVISG